MFGEPDLVVLDLMLPGEDGLAVCRRLRGAGENVPIIMLTAKGEDVDRIVGLEMGADDYLPKPFNPRELVARIHAVLRRHAERPAPAQAGGRSRRRSRPISTPRARASNDGELDPPHHRPSSRSARLLRAAPAAAARAREADAGARPRHEVFDRAIDVQVSRLRKLIEREGELIKTVRSAGYIFTGTVKEA